MRTRVMGAIGSCLVVLAGATSPAQIVVRGTESSDQTASSSRVVIKTPDREAVPILKDTRKTQDNDGTRRDESVTRVRLNDGTYFDWQRNTTVKKDVAADVAEISSEIVEKDRQGDDRTVERKVQTIVKTDTGEKSRSQVYTRDSSGQLVLDHVVDATTVKGADGRTSTSRVEQAPDVNGNLVVKKVAEEVAVEQGPNEMVTTVKTRSAGHLTGTLDVTEESTIATRTDGARKQIETVVRKPGRDGWQVAGRTTTTETTAPDGSVTRETIEQSPPAYSTSGGSRQSESLVPQRKVVERELRRPDGMVVIESDAFLRDVNGDWRLESFSRDQPPAGIGGRTPAPVQTASRGAPESSEPARPAEQTH